MVTADQRCSQRNVAAVVNLLVIIALELHKGRAVASLAGTRANDIKYEKIAVTWSAPKKLRE